MHCLPSVTDQKAALASKSGSASRLNTPSSTIRLPTEIWSFVWKSWQKLKTRRLWSTQTIEPASPYTRICATKLQEGSKRVKKFLLRSSTLRPRPNLIRKRLRQRKTLKSPHPRPLKIKRKKPRKKLPRRRPKMLKIKRRLVIKNQMASPPRLRCKLNRRRTRSPPKVRKWRARRMTARRTRTKRPKSTSRRTKMMLRRLKIKKRRVESPTLVRKEHQARNPRKRRPKLSLERLILKLPRMGRKEESQKQRTKSRTPRTLESRLNRTHLLKRKRALGRAPRLERLQISQILFP